MRSQRGDPFEDIPLNVKLILEQSLLVEFPKISPTRSVSAAKEDKAYKIRLRTKPRSQDLPNWDEPYLQTIFQPPNFCAFFFSSFQKVARYPMD